MREAAIISTARTAIGRAYRGAFNDTEAPVLSAHVVDAALERAGIDPTRVDDVYLGCGNHWNTQSYNLGRLTVHASKLPNTVGGFLMDRKCSSGLNAIALSARSLMCDDSHVAAIEHEFGSIRAAHAQLVELLRGVKTRRAPFDDESRDALRAARAGQARVDDHDIRFGAVRDPHLAAVEHVVIASECGGEVHSNDVRSRLRLAHRERTDMLT